MSTERDTLEQMFADLRARRSTLTVYQYYDEYLVLLQALRLLEQDDAWKKQRRQNQQGETTHERSL